MPEGTVANRRNLLGELYPEKTLARMVDALVLKLSIKLVVAKEEDFLVQKVK